MAFIIAEGYNKDVEAYKGTERFDFWCDVVSDEFVQLDCDGLSAKNRQQFSGSLRGGIGLGPVRFSEVKADPQVAIRSSKKIAALNEDDFLISFQLEEECVVSQNGRQAHLTPGSFALYDSTAEYSLAFRKPFHQFVLQMPRDVLARHLLEPEKYTAVAVSAGTGIGHIVQNFIFSLVRELAEPENQPGELLSENLVNLIALSLTSTVLNPSVMESDHVREALVRRIRQFIDNNLFDQNLSNARIAESQNISLRYLHKLFHDECESIREYVVRRRLDAAQQLLQKPCRSRLSIESIAAYVGFASAAHFSRSYKAHFGFSPSQTPLA